MDYGLPAKSGALSEFQSSVVEKFDLTQLTSKDQISHALLENESYYS